MADFNITIGRDSTYQVTKTSETSTECATIYTYTVEALAAESITITLTGNYDNATYTSNGVTNPLVSPQVVAFSASLTFSFSIENSGKPGVFYSTDVNVVNTTTVEPIDAFNFTVERANDGAKCASETLTYDELTDTPDNKVGQSLKLVRVSLDETKHEYVDPGTLGNDLNYTHVQASSTSWAIPHNLGKIPSVTVIDGYGNRVHGDVDYVDLNNLTIKFNTAFAGTAYLN